MTVPSPEYGATPPEPSSTLNWRSDYEPNARSYPIPGAIPTTSTTGSQHKSTTGQRGSSVGECGNIAPKLFPGDEMSICWLAHGHTGSHTDGTATWTNVPSLAEYFDPDKGRNFRAEIEGLRARLAVVEKQRDEAQREAEQFQDHAKHYRAELERARKDVAELLAERRAADDERSLAAARFDDARAGRDALVAEVERIAGHCDRLLSQFDPALPGYSGAALLAKVAIRLRQAIAQTAPQTAPVGCHRWCDFEISGRHAKGCVRPSEAPPGPPQSPLPAEPPPADPTASSTDDGPSEPTEGACTGLAGCPVHPDGLGLDGNIRTIDTMCVHCGQQWPCPCPEPADEGYDGADDDMMAATDWTAWSAALDAMTAERDAALKALTIAERERDDFRTECDTAVRAAAEQTSLNGKLIEQCRIAERDLAEQQAETARVRKTFRDHNQRLRDGVQRQIDAMHDDWQALANPNVQPGPMLRYWRGRLSNLLADTGQAAAGTARAGDKEAQQ